MGILQDCQLDVLDRYNKEWQEVYVPKIQKRRKQIGSYCAHMIIQIED